MQLERHLFSNFQFEASLFSLSNNNLVLSWNDTSNSITIQKKWPADDWIISISNGNHIFLHFALKFFKLLKENAQIVIHI